MNQEEPKKIRKWNDLTQAEKDQKITDLEWAFDAFYGMSTPLSFKRNVAHNFTNMLTEIYNDICAAFPKIEKELARKATQTMLRVMHELGAKSPAIYFSDSYLTSDIVITGFECALRVVKGKSVPSFTSEEDQTPLTLSEKRHKEAKALQLKREEDEELAKRHAERAPLADKLHKEYHSMKNALIKNGEEVLDAKLQAWVHILNEVWDGGLNYGYHIVTFKIPHDEDFYGDPYFVKMLLTNPTTQKHGEILSPKEGKETKPGDLGKGIEKVFSF